MNNASTSGMQNLMRIERLIANDLQDILQKENDNENTINLYNIGEYWVAFEKSAYQLEQISDNVDASVVIRLKNHPFPLIFNTISSRVVRKLYKKSATAQFLQLPTSTLNRDTFKNWYKELTLE